MFQLVPNKTEWRKLEVLKVIGGKIVVLKDGDKKIFTSLDPFCLKIIK